METLTAYKARVGFGEALQKAQHKPITITKGGKPFAVLMSIQDYEATEELKLQALQAILVRAEKDLQEGNYIDGESFMQELTDGIDD